jgi:hypothetical protein
MAGHWFSWPPTVTYEQPLAALNEILDITVPPDKDADGFFD